MSLSMSLSLETKLAVTEIEDFLIEYCGYFRDGRTLNGEYSIALVEKEPRSMRDQVLKVTGLKTNVGIGFLLNRSKDHDASIVEVLRCCVRLVQVHPGDAVLTFLELVLLVWSDGQVIRNVHSTISDFWREPFTSVIPFPFREGSFDEAI